MVFTQVSWKEFKKSLIKKYGFEDVWQNWSHMKLKYKDWSTIIIPDHKQLKEWLFNALLSQIWLKFWKTKIDIFLELFK